MFENNVGSPVEKSLLKDALDQTYLLGKTTDGKKIYITNNQHNPDILLYEIARLREETFRLVGEGTGRNLDWDIYDYYYYHLIVWDSVQEEISGAYRLGLCEEIINDYGVKGIYNSEQFDFSDEFVNNYLKYSLELGRSFVQYKYWKSNTLNYLWQGIGGFLQQHDSVKYLWGAVSISNSYSIQAKNLIVSYYKKYYSLDRQSHVFPKNRFTLDDSYSSYIDSVLSTGDYVQDFKNLKHALASEGVTLPVLLRRYSELCEYGGVKYLEYGVDPGFADSIDCLVLVDLSKIKDNNINHFYNQKSLIKN